MDILKTSHLSKKFGEQTVINDLSFSVGKNRVFGFLGVNGAGKTTTMKMILGLLKPDSGEITVLGKKVSYGQTKTNKHIGYLPDVPEFYNYMSPHEYLLLCGEITGLSKEETKKRSEELLILVGLDNVKKRIGGFSRGMKQRLGIAQALLNEPELLICDEPTSALDPIGRREILDILSKVKEKTTVIFSTHILSDVERICDDIAIIDKGKIVLTGKLSEIKQNNKKESLLIEFSNKDQANRFINMDIRSKYIDRYLEEDSDNNILNKDILSKEILSIETDNLKIIIYTKNIEKLEELVIELLATGKLLPTKLEVIEPTLENLFMEVVK